MKGLKGERRAYGITSPLHILLHDAGLKYQGSRIQRDSKTPWVMYETDRGDPALLAPLNEALLKRGYEHHRDLDGETEVYPQHGTPGRGQRYTQYRYERRGKDGVVDEVLYLTSRFYDAGKGKKDYTSFDHIFY